jgi:hypothetical protein
MSQMDSSSGMSNLGIFSYTTPTTVGDEYVGPNSKTTIHNAKGKRQFQTTPMKKGKTASNWGSTAMEFQRLFEGEPYVDPHKAVPTSSEAKFTQEKSFKPSSASKRQLVLLV